MIQPLQLTPTERVGITEEIKTAINQTGVSTVISLERYTDITLVVEYDAESDAIIFSIKIERMKDKTPPQFLGCPKEINGIIAPDVVNFCEEIESLLKNEFDSDATVGDADFVYYDVTDGAGWYVYQTSL